MSEKVPSNIPTLNEPLLCHESMEGEGIDMALLKDSLAKTPWERMQANDDALNFAESLRAAMQRRHAKSH